MTQKDTIDIVAEATDLRRKLEEARIIAGYYRGRMEDAEVRMASMELTASLKALEPLKTPKHGWIKTADRKPEPGVEVLTAGHDGKWWIRVMKYVNDYDEPCGFSWRYKSGGYINIAVKPMYWTPLPPLPEEGK
jgi:hypothetical protein